MGGRGQPRRVLEAELSRIRELERELAMVTRQREHLKKKP